MSKTDLAREIVREYIDLGIKHNRGYSKRFIATVLQSKHPDLFKDVEDARRYVRIVTGANGRKRKIDKQLMEDFALLENPITECKLNLIHGHEYQGGGGIHVAYNRLNKAMDNVMSGHSHVTQSNMKKTITGKFYGSWAVGCLCSLSARYNPQNNWNHGFAIVERDDEGEFVVDNRRIIDGKVF